MTRTRQFPSWISAIYRCEARWLSAGLLLLALCSWTTAYGQITPSGDAYTNTATPTTSLGTKPLLDVESGSQTTYILFDLSSIPSGYTSASIAKATLKLYVNAVTAAGSFNVDYVNGTWSEKTITASVAPALGTTIVSSVPLTSANVHDYVLIDVTTAVGAWLDGTEPNDGIALVGNSPLNASFDSKENTANSHPPELDIVFAGGGTITGVKTGPGSGLTGGGTTGDLNLSLTSCAANQVLQSNGSGWACSSAGSGTVTSVNTPSGSGLTGGPITSTGTLSIAPAGVSNAMLANPSVTINTLVGLTGGATVPLGGSITLGIDGSKVPELNTSNNFAGNQNNFAGNVGVGTTTPGTQLDVFSSTAGAHAPMARFGSNGAGDSNSTLIYNGTGVTEMFQAGFPNAFVTGTVAGDGGLRVKPGNSIFFGDNQGNPHMVITGGGNVVVNSSAPTVIGNPACRGGGSFGGIGFGASSMSNCTNYSVLGDTLNTYLNRPAGGQILFRENNATEMVLAAGGNLGIGIATPAYLLHVNGTARAEAGLSLGGNATLSVDAPGVLGGHFTVTSNGTVGINNPNPTHALDVTGAVSINGDAPMTSNPRMSFSGFVQGSFCGSLNCGSGSSSGPGGFFVPDKNIEITHISVSLGNAMDPSCNAAITVSVNGALRFSLAVPGNTSIFDAATTVQANAGDQVVLSYTPATSCSFSTSAGGNAMINAYYFME